MLTREEVLFLIVWILNLLISVAYYCWGVIIYVPAHESMEPDDPDYEKDYDNRRTYMIRLIVMVLCPVVGPCFFLGGFLVYKTIFRQSVDLEDVVFSKDRIKMRLKADEERERDMVPVEEALAITNKKNLRTLMISVLLRDIQDSLESITLALNSKDSETSHYAASVLRDELNEFRVNVQEVREKIDEENEDETECEQMLIDYMNTILKQKVFTNLEQQRFVQILDETAEILYHKDCLKLSPERYEGVCLRLLEQEKYEECEKWCSRISEQYPEDLVSYTCRLKMYFKKNEKENFFEALEALKQSDIVIDSETLELIRVFS